jgi:hypothetical protein
VYWSMASGASAAQAVRDEADNVVHAITNSVAPDVEPFRPKVGAGLSLNKLYVDAQRAVVQRSTPC